MSKKWTSVKKLRLSHVNMHTEEGERGPLSYTWPVPSLGSVCDWYVAASSYLRVGLHQRLPERLKVWGSRSNTLPEILPPAHALPTVADELTAGNAEESSYGEVYFYCEDQCQKNKGQRKEGE